MAITTRDQLINAMANNSSRIFIDKPSISNTIAGQFHSLWRSNGQPGLGGTPGAAAIPTDTTLGAIKFTQQTGPSKSYLSILEGLCTNNSTTLELHDRIMHNGGLNGTLATPQNVVADVHANLPLFNIAERIGNADYSDLTWWIEWYIDTGSTAVTVTVNVTYNDGTTGNLTGISLGIIRRTSFMQPLNTFVPIDSTGKYICCVNSLTLSATTGGQGNFGITCTKHIASLYKPLANARFTSDWANLGLPLIPNQACLSLIQLAGATSTGAVRATGKIAHG